LKKPATRRKCRARDCKRKIEVPYTHCSLECYAYDGGNLKYRGSLGK